MRRRSHGTHMHDKSMAHAPMRLRQRSHCTHIYDKSMAHVRMQRRSHGIHKHGANEVTSSFEFFNADFKVVVTSFAPCSCVPCIQIVFRTPQTRGVISKSRTRIPHYVILPAMHIDSLRSTTNSRCHLKVTNSHPSYCHSTRNAYR